MVVKKKAGGKPLLPKDKKRFYQVHIRMTEEEYTDMKRIAEYSGFNFVAAAARAAIQHFILKYKV